MPKQVVILGGGTGGTLVANRLTRRDPDIAVTVIDQDDRHVSQPGLLFLPFGLADADRLVRPRHEQLRDPVTFVRAAVDRVDTAAATVHLRDGATVEYDVLVIASGAVLAPQETEGLTDSGWMERIFTFYSLEGATALQRALEDFAGGRLIVNVVDMPIKCPVAPLEFCFLADWYFHQRGNRANVEITYVTPLDGAFTKPIASRHLGHLLAKKGIRLVTDFNTGAVDGEAGQLISYDDRSVPFDLAVVVPLHTGAAFVGRSAGLGDELNFVPTDPGTLQAKAAPNIFVLGDASDLAASKAGSVAHFEGETLVKNVIHCLAGQPLESTFDGHANCFIETGYGRALLIDFNDATEPLPGHYPSRIGLPLLKESRLNHIGKRFFEWFYWHGLLPGRDVPGLGAAMPRSGKELLTAATEKE